MSLEKLLEMNGKPCVCGKCHSFSSKLEIGRGAVKTLPRYVAQFGAKKIYLLSDCNTWQAAGQRVSEILRNSGFCVVSHSFADPHLEPDETAVGGAMMHFMPDCDAVVAVGSGVINDIGKIVSSVAKLPYIIVGTAPSMDGYASATSSMTRDGLKVSLPTKAAEVIIGDTDILCNAPLKMMRSGLGDMLAKYVSICDWRVAHLITGEYYCSEVAALIRGALKQCVDRAEGLLQRDPAAVQAVFEGLVIGGIAMNYAGVSRPASGVEHYISHCLDMRSVSFGAPGDLHGIQCAIGTRIAVEKYEALQNITPNREQALRHGAEFDYAAWAEHLRTFLGRGAESMIRLEQEEGKYDPAGQRLRLEKILTHWQEILEIAREELPSYEAITELLDRMEMPKNLSDIGIEDSLADVLFDCTKDIRDKYVLSRLYWDLGLPL